MTFAEYSEIIEKMAGIVEHYDRIHFKDSKYFLCLANGDAINVRIPENRIAHLLGVNIDYLRGSGKFKPGMNSYEILKYFLQESHRFSKLCSADGPMKFEGIFSSYVHEKLETFEVNTHISTANIICIVKYDHEKTYKLEEVADVSDYYIVRKEKDNSYYVLGLVQSEKNDGIYYPTTSRKYSDQEQFDVFMSHIANKQGLTYPYLNMISNSYTEYKNTYRLSPHKKTKVLKNLNEYAREYHATAATSTDFLFVITKNIDTLEKQENIGSILKLLHESLKNGSVMDEDVVSDLLKGDADIDLYVKKLVDTYNHLMCSKESLDNEAITNYPKIKDENKELKQELEILKFQLQECQEEKVNLAVQNEQLRQQNDLYNGLFYTMEAEIKQVKIKVKKNRKL